MLRWYNFVYRQVSQDIHGLEHPRTVLRSLNSSPGSLEPSSGSRGARSRDSSPDSLQRLTGSPSNDSPSNAPLFSSKVNLHNDNTESLAHLLHNDNTEPITHFDIDLAVSGNFSSNLPVM